MVETSSNTEGTRSFTFERSRRNGFHRMRATPGQAPLCLASPTVRPRSQCWGQSAFNKKTHAAQTDHTWLYTPGRSQALWLVLLLCMASRPQCASAQQSPPLQGQGITPHEAGLTDLATPVFMSVEVLKLMSLDEQAYQFGAILQFQQSWYDPRADAILKIVTEKNQEAVDAQGSLADCASTLNFTDDACTKALPKPDDCKKYCDTSGTGATDKPFLCCDALWLPDMRLRNLLYTSQDRIATDTIWSFGTPTSVHRETLMLGLFSTPLEFRAYPFDRQKLQVFVDPNYNGANKKDSALTEPPFFIVPSAVFRRLNQKLSVEDDRIGTVAGLSKDELAGWQIDNITFSCTGAGGNSSASGNSSDRFISVATQTFDSDDIYNQYYSYLFGQDSNPSNLLIQTCALTIDVSRLSKTVVVQSIVPVAFIGLLSFVSFFAELDDLEVRLGTEVSLFLALTAVQFIFTSVLPVTSYLTNFDVFILMSYCLIMAIVIEILAVAYIYTRVDHHVQKGYIDEEGALTELSLHHSRGGSATRSGASNSQAGTTLLQKGSSEGSVKLGQVQEDEAGQDEKKRNPSEEGEDDSDGPAPPDEPSRSKGSSKIPVGRFHMVDQRMGQDKKYAYRIASWIDITSAVVLFVTYVILAVVNFTVGFT